MPSSRIRLITRFLAGLLAIILLFALLAWVQPPDTRGTLHRNVEQNVDATGYFYTEVDRYPVIEAELRQSVIRDHDDSR